MVRLLRTVRRSLCGSAVLALLIWWTRSQYHSGPLLPGLSSTSNYSVMLAIRTSGQFHQLRLPSVRGTWIQHALEPYQVWVFSDDESVHDSFRHLPNVRTSVDGGCGIGHVSRILCCRLDQEITAFLSTTLRWFCHFDDDNYVNMAALSVVLGAYNAKRPRFLGRSATTAIHAGGSEAELVEFATGGAGFCLSRAALLQAGRSVAYGQLEKRCRKWRTPDDVTLAHALWREYRIQLTHTAAFHSHLEQLINIPAVQLPEQISLSYSLKSDPHNVISIEGLDPLSDPTRFRSLHCLLHGTDVCV